MPYIGINAIIAPYVMVISPIINAGPNELFSRDGNLPFLIWAFTVLSTGLYFINSENTRAANTNIPAGKATLLKL